MISMSEVDNQQYYDIVMLNNNSELTQKKIGEILDVNQEIISKAFIWWLSPGTITKLCTGEIPVDPNNYKKYIEGRDT